ncbi:TauD/TfdA family dioxygenase [Falsiroseomonas sp. HC035]|uniref:TauD/TfdA family dioxygenase n=1 Tax=Falsiroseomonas sp. HC035 TaxID=3390999 RepID=UPI003D31DB27
MSDSHTPTIGTPRSRLVPQAGPAAWRAADLRPSDWMIPVGSEDVAELEQALAALGGRAPATAAEAPLPRLGAVLRGAGARLDTGRGFVVLRGLTLDKAGDRLGEALAEPLLMALGTHLGRPLPGEGGAVQRQSSPAGSALRWRFHADAADVVALLVLRQPPDGDPAMLVAAATVHNEMMKRDRGALEILHRPLPHAAPGGAVLDLPVFSTASGAFVGRYSRDAIDAAQRLPETPRLTGAQMQALELLDAICAEPGLALRLDVRPGDVLLFNPLQVWKRRPEALEEPAAGEAAATREALRLLLLTETSRALPQGLLALSTGRPEDAAPDAGVTPPAAGATMVGG